MKKKKHKLSIFSHLLVYLVRGILLPEDNVQKRKDVPAQTCARVIITKRNNRRFEY